MVQTNVLNVMLTIMNLMELVNLVQPFTHLVKNVIKLIPVSSVEPVFILMLTLFGFAAGVKTMMRSARELQNKELAAQDSTEKDDIDG